MAEATHTFSPSNLVGRTMELWKSGRQVWWTVTEETFRVTTAIKNAAKKLNEGRAKSLVVVCHDRWTGFHQGIPPMTRCKDKTEVFGTALQMAMMSKQELDEAGLKPAFNPEDDIVFVFKGVTEELRDQPPVCTLLKNIVMANACSPEYVKDRGEDDQHPYTRGSRMIVLVTTTMTMPESIPELKPEIIPLPNYQNLKNIALDCLEAEWEAYKESEGKDGIKPLEDAPFDKVILSLHGMTAADAEEVLALAMVRHEAKKHREIRDLDGFLDTIEREKAKVISKIPGLTYIPKSDIVGEPLPGYESLTQFLDDSMAVPYETALDHNLTPLRGMAFGSAPGCGKTEIAKYSARRLARIGLLWNIGESKGGTVGASEAHTRMVIQIARAMRAFVLCDDIDKGGIAKSKDYSGDGGTSGNMVQMLLTEMSDPTSDAIYCFTFNRVPDLPELLRPGRVDERFYVERPNGTTRLAILKNHIKRVKLEVDDAVLLEKLAFEMTSDWTGAELAHVLIRTEARRTLAEGSKVMKVARMVERAKGFTPMCKQRSFAEDIRLMEEACSQFQKIGNLPETEPTTVARNNGTRSRRQTQS